MQNFQDYRDATYTSAPDNTGASDVSGHLQAFLDSLRDTGETGFIDQGVYKLSSQITVVSSTTGIVHLNIIQDRHARFESYVTGATDGQNTAGYAFHFNGLSESSWRGLYVNLANGDGGVVVTCRNGESISNYFDGWRITGTTSPTGLTERDDRARIGLKFIGNESGYTAANANYFHRVVSPYFNCLDTCVVFAAGDGSANTYEPNGINLIGPQFSRYFTAVNFGDSREHMVTGAFHHYAPADDLGGSPSITQSSGTATVTLTAHGLETGDLVYIEGASPGGYNGTFKITKTGADTFTYACTSSLSSPATGTIVVYRQTVGYRGNFSLCQVQANLEPSTPSYSFWIDDGGSGANQFWLINNTGAKWKVEDSTEKNMIFDRQYIDSSAETQFRVNGTNVTRLIEAPGSSKTVLYIRVNNGSYTEKQVELGASDSGGTGYRMLRVTN